MTTRCSCRADGLTEHGKCSSEFCYARSVMHSDEERLDSDYLSRSADNCLTENDHRLGARSKHSMPLLSPNETAPGRSLSCFDDEGPEGKQRLHRWREAGQALRDYLTQASGQVTSCHPQQTDVLSTEGLFDQDTAHNLCAACWNVDIPINTPSSATQTSCIYTTLKSGCFARDFNGPKYSEKTVPTAHFTSCNTGLLTGSEKGITQELHENPSECTRDGSHVLPLFDELHENVGHSADDRDRKKNGVLSDRRRHRLDKMSKRRQLHCFSDSSSSDSEVRQLCQPASMQRNKRLTNKQFSFGKFQPLPLLQNCLTTRFESNVSLQDGDSVNPVSSARCNQLNKDPVHFAGNSSSHWKNTCLMGDDRPSQNEHLYNKLEKKSKLCLEDLNSFSSSSSDTDSFSNSDVEEDAVILPPVSTLEAIDDRLFSQHPHPSTFCLRSDRLFPCSSSSASSRQHSPLPLLCCDEERHSVAAELAEKNDFTTFQTKVHGTPREGLRNMSYEESSRQPFYLMPLPDSKNDADLTSLANCTDNLNELAISDTSTSLDESSWDLRLENIETEADDEFECDCPVCLMNHDRIRDVWQANEFQLRADAREESGAATNNDTELFSFSVDEPDYLSIFSHSDVLESLFHDVILQMLQVYPDLFTSHTPPPVSTEEFNRLPSFRFMQSELGNDVSCPICLCVFEDGEEAKSLPCRHSFHTLCIQAWLNKAGTCPVCRDVVMQHIVSDDLLGHGVGDDLV